MTDVDKVINELLEKVTNDLEYEEPELIVTPIPETGGNYTSTLFRATLSGKDKPQLNLFAKVSVIGEKMRIQGLKKIFYTEHYVYTKLKNIYKEIEEAHDLEEEHRLKFPECYGFNTKEYEESIVIEDLTVKGFEVQDRLKPLTWDFAAAVVTELAKIHSLSFAFSIQRPEDFDVTCKELEVDMSGDEQMHELWRNMSRIAMEATVDENKAWLKKFIGDSDMTIFVKYYEPLVRPVIIHADSRVSNIMQKVDEEGRVHVRMVDFQTMQGASPVIDLMYFIFTSSDQAFRAQYYDKLIAHYYKQLSLCMERLGLDPEKVYSKANFDHEYNMKLPYGLSIALFTLPVVTVAIENAPKVTQDMDISCFKVENTSELFKERLNGIISDYIRWGVL